MQMQVIMSITLQLHQGHSQLTIFPLRTAYRCYRLKAWIDNHCISSSYST
uniref:Uncharacterized protein n=1 Tax=Rhizophora mucronata TaxID=61149 RepID=A0A2P2PIS9_RHIMU